MSFTCKKCGATENGKNLDALWYHLQHAGEFLHFCCRGHVIEYLAPELQQAVGVRQWIPTPEENDRMSQ